MYGLDPGMFARAMSSRPLWALGYPDRAEARARETLALARSQRQPVTLVFALLVTQGIHLFRGEAAEAMTMGDEVVALCRESGLPQERNGPRRSRARRSRDGPARRRDRAADGQPGRRSTPSAPAWCAGRSSACWRICCASPAAWTRAGALTRVRARRAHVEGGYLAELHRARRSCCGSGGHRRRGGQPRGAARLRPRAAGPLVRAARRHRLAQLLLASAAHPTRAPCSSRSKLVHRRPRHRGSRGGTRDARPAR